MAMLMPPPFCQRHASYLQRYKDTGEARILDAVKEVVALSKVSHTLVSHGTPLSDLTVFHCGRLYFQ